VRARQKAGRSATFEAFSVNVLLDYG